MRAAAARLGDAMLRRILPQAVAGACVPENGHACRCGPPCGVFHCTQYFFNCNGACLEGAIHFNC